MTEKYDATNVTLGPSIAAFDVLQVSAGSSGSKSSTVSGNKNRNWAAQQIALRRAPIGHISVETGANGATSFASTGPATTFTFSKSVSASSTLLIVHFPLSDATGVTYDGIPMNVATSGLSSPTYYLVIRQAVLMMLLPREPPAVAPLGLRYLIRVPTRPIPSEP